MFDGYRDEEVIGEGGLGRVYRAVRLSTNGVVAIKSLRDVEDSSPAWHRANRELEAMLRVKGHPYVVTVEEIFLGPEGPCLVMEYLPGGSIAERMSGELLGAPQLVVIGQHVTEALIAAHDVGIVHRDIKPANLMVGPFGQVKVGDFGISALARGDDQTKTAALTLAYASPEELDGELRAGPPADVFSLAATFHHLMSGERPMFSARINGWQTLRGQADPALEPLVEVIEAGLSQEITDRPTMREFSVACDAAAQRLGPRAVKHLDVDPTAGATVVRPPPPSPPLKDPLGQSSPPAPAARPFAPVSTPLVAPQTGEPPSSNRLPMILGAVAAVLVLAIAGVLIFGSDDGTEPGPTTLLTAEPAVTVREEGETEPSVAPLDSVDGVLRFVGLFPETGDMEMVAVAPQIGAELAVDDINAAGGVLGQPVELVSLGLDTVGLSGPDLLAALQAEPNLADVVIGPLSSDGDDGLVAALRESGRLTITPAATDDAFTGSLFARLVGSNMTQGRAIAQQISDDGFSTVAMVGLDDAVPTAIRQGAAGGPIDVVLDETYDGRIGEIAQILVDEDPDAVLITGFEQDTAALLDAIDDITSTGLPFAVYGTDGNTGGGLVDELTRLENPELATGMTGTFVAAPIDEEFAARVAAAGDTTDETYSAEAYDAVVLAALAAIADDSDDPELVVDQLIDASSGGTLCSTFAECAEILEAAGDIDYQGRSGDVDLNDDFERAVASISVFRYDSAGEFVFERTIQQR